MRLTLCLIARNEASRLAACLSSIRPVVDEMVVVDTGSSDATRDVATKCGARVFEFPWGDDFAAARNEAIRHARRPWILSMDADDTVDADNLRRLTSLVASLSDTRDGFLMQVQSLGPRGGIMSSVGHVRLFRNHPRIRWDHRIHEQIATSVEDAGGRIMPSDVVITHHGYADPAELKRKLERNMALLDAEAVERPLDAVTQYHRAYALAGLGRLEEAIVGLNVSEGDAGVGPLHRKRQGLLARCYYRTGARREALEVAENARRLYPDDPELLYTDAQLRIGLGDLGGAEARLRAAIAVGPEGRIDCLDTSVFGSAGYYLLGLVLALQGRAADAEAASRAAVGLDSDLIPAWLVLMDAIAEQGRSESIVGLGATGDAPEIVAAIARACARKLSGSEGAARALPPARAGEHALLGATRAWAAQSPARARVLDILRTG